jgi:DNA repair exonuclease SbcCD nuclease subunit
VEGAVVGVQNYTFRGGRDVVRGSDIPEGITAVLSGHIHRAQVLTKDLHGQKLAAPVVFPGSIERTSFVERDEAKGFMILELDRGNSAPLVESGIIFNKLPTRPMVNLEVDVDGVGGETLLDLVSQQLAELDPDSVVRIQLVGGITPLVEAALSAAELRRISPPTMNVALARNRYSAMLKTQYGKI